MAASATVVCFKTNVLCSNTEMCFLPTDCLVTGAVWGSLGTGAGTGTVCPRMLTDCMVVRYSECLGTAFDSLSSMWHVNSLKLSVTNRLMVFVGLMSISGLILFGVFQTSRKCQCPTFIFRFSVFFP